MLHSRFSELLATLALCLSVSITRAAEVTFEDDRGVIFKRDNAKKAKICVRAGVGGLSLAQLGMKSEQLVCYWGLWGIRGSDFDPENPAGGSIYPEADPTIEEAALFEGAINFSPSCWKNPRGCFRWDEENTTDIINLVESGEVDFILTIDNGNDSQMKALEADTGIRTIFVDTFYEKSQECRALNHTLLDESKCYGRSMIDIAQRIEELAIFLSVDVDVPAIEKDKQDACDAAAAFSATMEEANARNMRIKVYVLGTAEYPEGSGINVPYARDFDPITLWVPRTIEELGAPLLHGGVYNKTAGENRDIVVDKFFVDCDDGLVNATCRDNTYHPVDFWLIDSRSYLLLEDWLNFDLFPDPAIMAGQFSYYPRNDGALSYRMIANLLNMYNEQISSAEKVSESDPGTCKAVDPKSSEIISKNGGLGLNDFICYNKALIQEEYLKCPPPPKTQPVDTPPADPLDDTATPPESESVMISETESGGVKYAFAFSSLSSAISVAVTFLL